jgi:basic membrane protein A
MMKNVDLSLYRALKLHLEGKLPFGQAEHLGIREGGVGLAKNRYYEEATPVDVRARINQTENDLKNGTIVVDTAFR